MNWNYTKNGNPTKEGTYIVCLVYPEYIQGEPTGKSCAEIDTRWFGESDGWRMEGEPKEGMAWTKECGSALGEKVFAWAEMPTFPEGLPEDVIKE